MQVEDWTPISFPPPPDTDVLVRVVEGRGFKEGEEYHAVDRLMSEVGQFRTDAFGYGRVTHWQNLPKGPNAKPFDGILSPDWVVKLIPTKESDA
jgi:hypothetical protein